MSEFDETSEDLRAAFEDLQDASEEPRHRRALKAVLNELYVAQEFRKGSDQKDYFWRAEAEEGGKVTLGIVYLRGAVTHHVTKPVGPTREVLYPGLNTYPSDLLYPGTNFVWISGEELSRLYDPPGTASKKGKPYYDDYVGGQPILPTIRLAIGFLLNDANFG